MTGTHKQKDTDAGSDTLPCSIGEAARLLGISERAVRRRMKAGTLASTRVGQRWMVLLPRAQVEGAAVEPPAPRPQEPELPEQRAESPGEPREGLLALEAGHRPSVAAIQQAIDRIDAQYTSELRALSEELARRLEAGVIEQAGALPESRAPESVQRGEPEPIARFPQPELEQQASRAASAPEPAAGESPVADLPDREPLHHARVGSALVEDQPPAELMPPPLTCHWRLRPPIVPSRHSRLRYGSLAQTHRRGRSRRGSHAHRLPAPG